MRWLLLVWLLGACSGASETEPETETASESESASQSESASASEAASESASESESEAEPETAPEPEADTLRFVVVHEGPELLGSEQRGLDQIRTGLARGRTVDAADASEGERAWLAEPEEALPERWARFETVVALAVAEPQTLRRRQRRVSRGLRSVHVFRPPATEAVYTMEGGPVGLGAEKELELLDALLSSLEQGESR